ncbi:hypothetical protein [Archaeoglobus sulfaticallidus]|uniref:hypothetical protein n=1 Tax=Archaeoglobus sulfaticallidus TaxID=1316941 RepID=UPI000A460A12|nr:hypothetical protein [Archaeoglobus sulfaticallidus]
MFVFTLLVVALGVLAVGANAEVVDSEGDVGKYTSIALDSNDNPHISYVYYPSVLNPTNSELKYAWKDSNGKWHIETVDRAKDFRDTSIALDSNGNPHISYHNFSWTFVGAVGELKYTYPRTDYLGDYFWHIETVESGFDRGIVVGEYTSVALDSNDNPHISYCNATFLNLEYAWKDSNGNWHTETVDDGGIGTSIALDSNGNPHISYSYNNGSIKYAYKDIFGWHTVFVEVGCSTWMVYPYTSLALDSNGNPHISYCYYYNNTFGEIKYAEMFFNPIQHEWERVIETVDSSGGGRHPSLALDSNGNPHISYYDATNGDLKYAYKDANGWHIETVDSEGDVGKYTSLALDSNGYPHISYYDATNGDLKYTTKQPTIVNLKGGITDLNGNPVSTASMRVTVKNVDGQTVYQETFNDVVGNGKFNVLLGATQTLELWEGVAYNLIIEVDVDSTTFSTADVTFGDGMPAEDVIVFHP